MWWYVCKTPTWCGLGCACGGVCGVQGVVCVVWCHACWQGFLCDAICVVVCLLHITKCIWYAAKHVCCCLWLIHPASHTHTIPSPYQPPTIHTPTQPPLRPISSNPSPTATNSPPSTTFQSAHGRPAPPPPPRPLHPRPHLPYPPVRPPTTPSCWCALPVMGPLVGLPRLAMCLIPNSRCVCVICAGGCWVGVSKGVVGCGECCFMLGCFSLNAWLGWWGTNLWYMFCTCVCVMYNNPTAHLHPLSLPTTGTCGCVMDPHHHSKWHWAPH